jgi:hypothetical protein
MCSAWALHAFRYGREESAVHLPSVPCTKIARAKISTVWGEYEKGGREGERSGEEIRERQKIMMEKSKERRLN